MSLQPLAHAVQIGRPNSISNCACSSLNLSLPPFPRAPHPADAMVVFPLFGLGVAGFAGLRAMGFKTSMDLAKMQQIANRLKSVKK